MSTAKAKAAANDAPPQTPPAVAAGKDAAKPQPAAALKSYEEVVGSTRETLEALIQAGTILSQGMQDISRAMVSLAQESVESGVAASKQLMAAKTLRELIDLQTNLAKQGFDRLLGETTRLSDLSVKLAEDAFAPLTERVNATVDKLVKRAA